MKISDWTIIPTMALIIVAYSVGYFVSAVDPVWYIKVPVFAMLGLVALWAVKTIIFIQEHTA